MPVENNDPVPPKVGPTEPGIHFGWFSVLAGIGIVVTYVAFWGPFVPNLGENAVAVWQSIFTNFGVGIFSAAVLLLFEPKLRRVITKTVSKTVTEEVKRDVREAVQADIEERLASMEETISSRYDEMVAAQQGLAKDLVSNFTHERVMKLFREASNLGALDGQSITVHGDADPGDFLRVNFKLRLPDHIPRRDPDTLKYAGPEFEDLHVAILPFPGKPIAEVVWEPGVDFSDIAIALATELNATRVRGIAEKIAWGPILARLEKALDVAVNSSMRTPGALAMDGHVHSFVELAHKWYLTTESLYCPEIDYKLPLDQFRENQQRSVVGVPRATKVEEPQPEAPEGVKDASEWTYVYQLAKARSQGRGQYL